MKNVMQMPYSGMLHPVRWRQLSFNTLTPETSYCDRLCDVLEVFGKLMANMLVG